MIRKILVLMVLFFSTTVVTAANLIPTKTFNTVDWVNADGGFQACSGGSGSLPCVDGSSHLVFAWIQKTVTRSFTVTQPLHNVSFIVNGQGQFGTDPGTVHVRAFNAGNQLLEDAVVTNEFPDGVALPVNLVLQDDAALATATRIEVEITGGDNNSWSGNYGTRYFEPQLFTNDIDGDGLEDSIDADADGDGVIDRMQVSAGNYNTCALVNNGVHCWGDTMNGQLNMPALNDPASISAGYHVCALDTTGVHCWANNGNGQTNVPPLSNPRAVSAGGFHTCALDDAGVHCWGYNYNGQTTVPTLNQPVAVSAGYLHTCAVDADGVHCWGDNANGKTTVPVLVDPVAVSAGLEHTCALDASGIHCWGRADYGQLNVPTLSNPTAMAVGATHSCALDDTGVHCWGNNDSGQTAVPTLDTPQSITAGAYHTCAVDKTGVHCWGYNGSGQSVVPATLSPVVDNCPRLANADQLDTDEDGIGDACDPDIDGDGVANASDAFPLDATETVDSDSDGTGNNADTDDDDDDVLDASDAFPLDAAESTDTDNDGIGNNADTDDDNDTVLDVDDAFPLDPTETEDEDGDNLGNNSDPILGDANTLNNFLNDIKADKAGSSVAFAGDFNGDGYGDYVIGIPGYDVHATLTSKTIKDAGRAVVISGKNGGVLASVDGWATKNAMGVAVAGNGDINKDGFDDVIVGSPNLDKNTGVVQILFGPNGEERYGIGGSYTGDLFGSSVALADVNGDGEADILIGAPKADDLRDLSHKIIDAGSVIVFSGENYSVLNTFYGTTAKAYAGTAVATGNVDAVTGADIIIGAPNDDDVVNKLKETGSVTVYNIADATTPVIPKQFGAVAKAYLGKSVAAGNTDGVVGDEVLAGAPGDDTPATPSAKKIVDTGSVTVFSSDDGSQLTKQYGAVAKAGLGNSVAAGDVNNDGNADIIAGASKDDSPTIPKITKDTGSVSVFDGSSYSLITTLYGDVTKDAFGTSVSAGDVNGDDKADLIIGIPGFDIPPALPIKTIKDAGAVKVQSGAMLSL